MVQVREWVGGDDDTRRGAWLMCFRWKLATLILADAQSSHFLSIRRLNVVPLATYTETLAARLAGEVLGCQGHHEPL